MTYAATFPTPMDFQPLLPAPAGNTPLPGYSGVWVRTFVNCNRATPDVGCKIANATDSTDATPFTIEIISTTSGSWYHQIVGDANSDYVEEIYIRAGGTVGGHVNIYDNNGYRLGYECLSTCGSYSGGLQSSLSATHSTGSDLPRLGGNGSSRWILILS